MKKTIIAASIAMLLAPAAHAELFISEYVEGSSNNKALEFFNPTDTDIDLAPYLVQVYFNGSSSAGTTINLTGVIPAGGTFVYASSQARPELLVLANQTSGQSLWNGDDAITLSKNDVVIDSIGQIGVDPGSAWGSGDITTANDSLRRAAVSYDVNAFDTFEPADQWLGFPQDDFSDIGLFDGEGGGPGDPDPEPDPDPSFDLSCGAPFTPIHQVQGSGDASPLVGQAVVVEAVVTQTLPGLRGFTIQSASVEQDGDAMTSEGVFVFTTSDNLTVIAGQRVRLVATVAESFSMTQLTDIVATVDCGTASTPVATELQLPVPDMAYWEAHEGMLVSFSQPLTVNETFTLGRFGELTLSNGRRYTPTQVVAPGADAIALAAAHQLNRIILDDNSTVQNPPLVPYPAPALSAANTVRSGDNVVGLTGTLYYSFNEYRIMPNNPVSIVAANPRSAAPDLLADGNVKVASFNVLNYFNGDGLGGGFPTARGADSAMEFARQRDKILAAMAGLNANVIGLMELENDGFADTSAIADLVAGLRQVTGQMDWQFVQPQVSPIGTDQITVGLLYRSDLLVPADAALLLDSGNSALDGSGQPLFDDGRNRPMLAQRFRVLDNNAEFAVMVNHLKSKGSGCGAADGDNGDGQGNCNLSRTRAAEAIGIFAEQYFADIPAMVIGDLNAYAKEDPIRALAQAGYFDVFEALAKTASYGYVFQGLAGSLDHALLNQHAIDALADADKWNINADEPIALDYNVEFKTDQQLFDYYAPDAYRSSDHDPVIVSLQLSASFRSADLDQNSVVDRNDVSVFQQLLRQGGELSLTLDFNNDGSIDQRDIRALTALCDLPRCVTP